MNLRKKIFIISLLLLWGAFGVIILIGISPKTPLFISDEFKKAILVILPERWGFFTKSPKENYMFFLSKKNGSYKLHEYFPNSSSSNYYGIVKNQKAIGLEYGIISSKIPENLWYVSEKGENVLNLINADSIKTIQISNLTKNSSLKGEIIVIKSEPVPYAWRDKQTQFTMPSKFIKLRIINNDK